MLAGAVFLLESNDRGLAAPGSHADQATISELQPGVGYSALAICVGIGEAEEPCDVAVVVAADRMTVSAIWIRVFTSGTPKIEERELEVQPVL